MLARLDHRPVLTAALALSTTVLLVVVVTLLIMLPAVLSPARDSGSDNPARAAAPASMEAGGENYGWDIRYKRDSSGGNPEGHANRATPSENYGWDIHSK